MNNYTLPELIWAVAMLIWPICFLILAIVFKKDIIRLLSIKYSKKIYKKSNGVAQISKSDPVSLLAVSIKAKAEIKSEEQANLHLEDDSIRVEVCRNLESGRYFIIIDETSDNKATMITPQGDIKTLEQNLFSETEEIELNKLVIDKLITEQQLFSYNEYIDDNATKSIDAYLDSRMRSSTEEPKYVKNYREMLNNPSTIPSRMLNCIKENKETTWFGVKKILTDKYGYQDSGSFSASLRVLLIDGYIDIDGRGDNKTISISPTKK